MRLKTGVILTKLEEETVVVAVGEAGKAFRGMMKMNETAAFLTELLKEEQDEDGLVGHLLREYQVDAETARRNVRYVVNQLSELGLMETENS